MKRRVISTTEVMVMMPALGEKETGGCWAEPRLETVRFYRSGPRSVGATEESGVGTLVGIYLDTLWVKRRWDVGRAIGWRASVKNSVRTSVRLWSKTAWFEWRWDVSRAISQIKRGSIGRGLGRIQRGFIGQSLGRERRLWRINYSRMKKRAMVDGDNHES